MSTFLPGNFKLKKKLFQEAECERERQDARFKADTLIADSSRAYQMEKASFDQEVNTLTAEAELAYELQVS